MIAAIARRGPHGPEVLVTRRGGRVHLPGSWELPGGKVETHETLEQALRRELREEVGLRAGELEALGSHDHDYPDRRIRLHAFLARVDEHATIEPGASTFRWVPASSLDQAGLPEANKPLTDLIVAHLCVKQGDSE